MHKSSMEPEPRTMLGKPFPLISVLAMLLLPAVLPVVNAGNGFNCPGSIVVMSQPSNSDTINSTLPVHALFRGDGPGFSPGQCDIGWITACGLMLGPASLTSNCIAHPGSNTNCGVTTCYVDLWANYTFPGFGAFNFSALLKMKWGCCLWMGGPETSATASWTTTRYTALAPQNLAGMPGDNTITLSWSAPAQTTGTITAYRVYRGATNTTLSLLTQGGCSGLGNVLTCTDGGLGNNDTRYYQVAAVTSNGEGIRSGLLVAASRPFPSNPPSTRCGIETSPAFGRTMTFPAQWSLAGSSSDAGWQVSITPTQDAMHDLLGHTDPVRLWYTAENLAQGNYQAGADGDQPSNGTATSPIILIPESPLSTLRFSSRYSIESRDPTSKDQMIIEASTDGGQTWAFACKVNPTTAYDGTPDEATCSNGTPNGAYPCPVDSFNTPTPTWETRSIRLPTAFGGYAAQFRFKFDTMDGIQNAGLGWMITDIQITS